MRCQCASPRALSRSLSPLELVAAKTVVQQICKNDLQNGFSIDFGVQMTVFRVIPLAHANCTLFCAPNAQKRTVS